MMQLYLGGPKNKFFNIFSPPDNNIYDNFTDEDFIILKILLLMNY